MKIILIILLTLLAIEPSYSQVYRWVDEKGVVHFTDDFMNIPEKYRPKMDKVGVPEGKAEAKPEGEPVTKKKGEIYRDQLGRGEEYWKNRVEEWSKKLKTAQEKIENLRIKYNELTERINDSKSTAERSHLRKERDQTKQEMDQQRNQAEEAKLMLEKKIPEEAELYKARSEWIKQ